MCEERAPFLPVSRMIGFSSFGYYFGSSVDSASNNIQEVIYMGPGLMCNESTVYGGRMGLKIFVRDSFDNWKSLESESAMMFSVHLIIWECRDTSLMMRVHTNQSG